MNEARAEYKKETEALIQLRKELEASIVTTQAKMAAYEQAVRAGKRSLSYIQGHTGCTDGCWDRLVDFLHASQWQNLEVD